MSERNDSLSGPEDLLARERDDTLPWAGLPALRKLERSALPHGGTQDPIAARACAWRVELTAYLQDELPAAGRARVAAHVSECAGCAALLEAFRGTLEKLEPAAVEAPAPDLAPAILARLAEDDARVAVRRSWNAELFRAAAALIGLLTAGWLSWMWLAGRTPGTLARLPPGHPGREVPPAIAQRAQSATQRPDETAAIHQALAWLESTQEADGCWNTARWGAQPEYTVGVTALALLALCADRPAALSGPRAENLRRGLDYLVRQQDARGQFGPDGACALYNQSMATLALLEAGARQPEAAWHAAAGRGLAFIRAEQRATGGWGYAHGPRDAVNASVTVWQLQALIRAGTLDFADVRPTVARGLAWLEQTVNPADGLGYRQPNDAPFGHEALADAGILCRSKSKAHASVDHARLAQMLQADHAAAGQRVAVLTRQIRAGPAAGSWEPGDRWSRAGGRIYATAMAVLTLQAW